MLLHLLADEIEAPKSLLDVLLMPLLLAAGAMLIFYAGWWVENRLTKAPWKWLAFVPLAMCFYQGWTAFWNYRSNPVYSAMVDPMGKRMIGAHYVAILIPILALAAILLWHFFNHKLNLSIRDD